MDPDTGTIGLAPAEPITPEPPERAGNEDLDRSRRRRTRIRWLQAVLVLLVCTTVYVWRPLTSSGYYAPGDLTQNSPVLRTTPPGAQVGNSILGDVASEIVPWQVFDATQIRSGHLPLWNPYNGSGAPHLANGQSAPFSPYNVPFYVLSIRVALIVSAMMVLLASGLFTYGLARHLRVGQVGSILASVGFAFAGVNLVWLRWTVTATASFLPAVLWAACVVVDARTSRRRVLGLVGLATATALSLFSGHPETTLYSLGAAALLVGYRLVVARVPLRRALTWAAAMAGSVAVGIGIAAIQVLPVLEYLANRDPGGDRQAYVDTKYAGLLAFPFLKGSPFGSQRTQVLSISIPYIKGVELYLSAILLLLALVGLLSFARRRRALLAALGVAFLIFIFNLAGVGQLIAKVPTLALAIALRSIPLWALAVSLLAGVGVDTVWRARVSGSAARHRVLVQMAGAVIVLVILGIAFHIQLDDALPDPATKAGAAAVQAVGRQHVGYLVGWFLVGLLAVSLPLLVLTHRALTARAQRWCKLASSGLLLLALFATSGFLWRSWTPTVDPADFYARSTTFDEIQRVLGDGQTLRLDTTAIPPDTNMMYGVRSPENYDALGVNHYDALYRSLLHPPTLVFDGSTIGILAGEVDPAGLGSLRAVGIQYVTTGTVYPFAQGQLTGQPVPAGGASSRQFGFKPTVFGPKAVNTIVVEARSLPVGSTCRISVQKNGAEVSSGREPCRSPGSALSLASPVEVGRGFDVTVSVTNAAGSPDAADPQLRVTAVATKVTGLELVATVEGNRIYRVPGSPDHVFSPASTVGAAATVPVVHNPDMQPTKLSVVDAPQARSAGAQPGEVHVTRNEPGRIEFTVERSTPGWAMVMESYYPGWRATVDGHATEVRRGNEAFLAVRVGAGTSTVSVSYQPRSVEIGLIISVVSVIGLLAGAAVALFWRRKGSGLPT